MKYIACFFAILCGVFAFMYNCTKTKLSYIETKINALNFDNDILRRNNDVLQKELEKRNNDAAETSKRMRELAQLAEKEKNKGGFNWGSSLPNDSIVDRLRN